MIKRASLLLIVILTLSSFIMVEAATASAFVPKPSVPEFTVQFIDNSYDVPTTYTMDPYTGQQIANQGYHVENKCIVVKIKNQSLEPFKNEYNQTINLFYNVRIKGHFEENWTVLYRPVYGIPKQSTDSDYTVFSYTWKEHGDTWLGSWAITLRDGAKADFQVQAMIGRIVDYGPFSAHSPREDFEGETSGWSNTQTITIGTTASPSTSDTSPSTSPSPSPDSSSSSSQDSATATPDQSDNQAVSETDLYEIAVTASIALAVIVALTAGIMFVRGRSRRRGAQREQAFV